MTRSLEGGRHARTGYRTAGARLHRGEGVLLKSSIRRDLRRAKARAEAGEVRWGSIREWTEQRQSSVTHPRPPGGKGTTRRTTVGGSGAGSRASPVAVRRPAENADMLHVPLLASQASFMECENTEHGKRRQNRQRNQADNLKRRGTERRHRCAAILSE